MGENKPVEAEPPRGERGRFRRADYKYPVGILIQRDLTLEEIQLRLSIE